MHIGVIVLPELPISIGYRMNDSTADQDTAGAAVLTKLTKLKE